MEGLDHLANAANILNDIVPPGATQTLLPTIPNNNEPTMSPIGIDRQRKRLVLQRLRYEHFYSTMDQEYFKINEYEVCMAQIGYDVSKSMYRYTLSEMRNKMSDEIGTPRRFSHAFVMKERKRLHESRKAIRFACRTASEDSRPCPQAICKGDFVIVYSRTNKVLCRGRVVADGPFHSENRGYLVVFDNPQFRNEWCNDFDIQITERYYVNPAVQSSKKSIGGAESKAFNIEESIGEYIDHAKVAVVSVIELKSNGEEYPQTVLDTIVRCVALILWMKKSVDISNASQLEIRSLTDQALRYVTKDLNAVSSLINEEEKLSICKELHGAINQIFLYANAKATAI